MIECMYNNDTDQMVILKCIGENQFYREKVVMPKELYWFEAPLNSRLEIWQMPPQGQMLQVRADVSDYALNEKSAEESPTASLWAC